MVKQNIYYQFGVWIKNKAFLIPTVLMFILITSSLIFYQAISTINEIYGMQVQIKQLYKLEITHNIRRIVKESSFDSECKNKTELKYRTKEKQLSIMSNCFYTGVQNQNYANKIDKVLTEDKVSKEEYSNLINYSKIISNKTLNNNEVEIQINNQKLNSSYKQKYKIYFIEYGVGEAKNKIIISDNKNNIIKNSNVN